MRDHVAILIVLVVVVSAGALAVGSTSPASATAESAPNEMDVLAQPSIETAVAPTSPDPRVTDPPALAGSGETVARSSASATLEAAVDDSETVSMTFSPEETEEISFEADPGDEIDDVSLSFSGWTNLDTGESGTDRTWNGNGSHQYEVRYEASAPAGTQPGDVTFSDVTVDYDGGSASEDFEVRVIGPEFETTDQQSGDVVVRGHEGLDTTGSFSIQVPNEGPGVLVPTDVDFSGVPPGVDLTSSPPDRIDSGETGTVPIEATVSHATDEGTYDLTATVSDNLDNEETYAIELTVYKPPVVALQASPARIENATAGDTTTAELVVEELTGFDDVDGIHYEIETDDDDVASLSFEDLNELSIDSGGTATTNVSVTIDEDAERHRELAWMVTLQHDDEFEIETESDVESEVFYPARFAAADLDKDVIVYDQPRDEVDVIEDNVTVELENDGDFPLNVTEDNVTFDGTDLTVADIEINDTIDAQTTETAVVNVEGDPDAFEQVVDFRFELFGETPRGDDVEPAQFNDTVSIEHETELIVHTGEIDFGRIQSTGDAREAIEVQERLGYQDVESFDIAQIDGPDTDWLTFADELPGSIPAGETVSIPIELAFGVDAELFTTYEWAFLVSGEDVESSEVVVQGTPEPVNVDPVREDLQSFQDRNDTTGEIATEMLAIVDIVEDGVETGDVPRSDIATSLSAGRSIVLLLSELETAQATIENDGPDAAQESIVRASTAYNTFVLFAGQFEDDRLSERSDRIDEIASERVDDVVEQQETQFQQRLEEDPPLLERAELYRQLAQLAVLRGDSDRADRLEQEADTAFDAYADRIETGEESFRDARDARNRIANEHALDAFGQPILVNPLRYGNFRSDAQASIAAYDDAKADFREAGAMERANTVAAERDRVETELALTRLSMFASIGGYALLVVVLAAHVSLGVREYRIDRRTVAPDEFLQ